MAYAQLMSTDDIDPNTTHTWMPKALNKLDFLRAYCSWKGSLQKWTYMVHKRIVPNSSCPAPFGRRVLPLPLCLVACQIWVPREFRHPPPGLRHQHAGWARPIRLAQCAPHRLLENSGLEGPEGFPRQVTPEPHYCLKRTSKPHYHRKHSLWCPLLTHLFTEPSQKANTMSWRQHLSSCIDASL